MTVVGLHPEELFDKLLDGQLTPPERERLQLHLDSCHVCRFEHAARMDFRAEASELSEASPPPTLPLRVQLPLAEKEVRGARPVRALPTRRRRSRFLIWGLAAAALITASGAVAASLASGTKWHGLAALFARGAAPALPPAAQPADSEKTPVVVASRAAAPAPAPAVVAVDAVPSHALDSKAATTPGSPSTAHVKKAQVASVAPPTLLAGTTGARSETSSAKDVVAKEPSSAAKLFGEANLARRSGDIGRASGLYHLLQDQFPGSPEADLSRVTLALLLLDSGDAQAALSGFERYLAGSSRGLEAEALVGRARALGRLGRRDLEASAWREVQRKYPRSIYGRQATERLLALGQP